MADIRPASLKKTQEKIPQRSGEKLLLEAARRHGLSSFQKISSYEVTIRNEWYGIAKHFAELPGKPSVLNLIIHHDSNYISLINASNQTYWLLKNDKIYIKEGEVLLEKDNAGKKMALKTIQYFIEFPFRIIEAEIMIDLGEDTLHKQTYKKVFVTWSEIAPHKEHDQYIVWINSTTGLIDLIEFTVRETARFAKGAMFFNNYKKYNEVLFPTNNFGKTNIHKKKNIRTWDILKLTIKETNS